MTRVLIILVALYLLWRVATIVGRRREREVRGRLLRFAGPQVVRCAHCGRIRAEEEMAWSGVGPWRRQVCADGCVEGPREGSE